MRGQSLKTGVTALISGSIVGRILGFIFNLVLSRYLGPVGLGILGMVFTASQTTEVAARAGIDYGVSCELTNKNVNLGSAKQVYASTALRVVQINTVLIAFGIGIWVFYFGGILPNSIGEQRVHVGLLLILICIIEGFCGIPWELLVIYDKARLVSLRQGLFAPLRLGLAAIGALAGGVEIALVMYLVGQVVQLAWVDKRIHIVMGSLKKSLFSLFALRVLLARGLPVYTTNAASAVIFLPMLAGLAVSAGVNDVGYLRAGQILVQAFTLLPGAILPLLFLRLRVLDGEEERDRQTEVALSLVWAAGFGSLLLYTLLDGRMIDFLFGESFMDARWATRLLIYVAVIDSIGQVFHTRLLAVGRRKIFIVAQNGGALLAAVIGWLTIPIYGLNGFLGAKLCFSIFPVCIYIMEWSRRGFSGMWKLITSIAIFFPLCVEGMYGERASIIVCFLASYMLFSEVRWIWNRVH